MSAAVCHPTWLPPSVGRSPEAHSCLLPRQRDWRRKVSAGRAVGRERSYARQEHTALLSQDHQASRAILAGPTDLCASSSLPSRWDNGFTDVRARRGLGPFGHTSSLYGWRRRQRPWRESNVLMRVGRMEEVALEDSVLAHIERTLSWSSRGATAGVRRKTPGFWP